MTGIHQSPDSMGADKASSSGDHDVELFLCHYR
jgi:hypothetical protein